MTHSNITYSYKKFCNYPLVIKSTLSERVVIQILKDEFQHTYKIKKELEIVFFSSLSTKNVPIKFFLCQLNLRLNGQMYINVVPTVNTLLSYELFLLPLGRYRCFGTIRPRGHNSETACGSDLYKYHHLELNGTNAL